MENYHPSHKQNHQVSHRRPSDIDIIINDRILFWGLRLGMNTLPNFFGNSHPPPQILVPRPNCKVSDLTRIYIIMRSTIVNRLIERLLCGDPTRQVKKLVLGASIRSRCCHKFIDPDLTCVNIVANNKMPVNMMMPFDKLVLHQRLPFMVTGSNCMSQKLCRLSSDNTSATCMATLEPLDGNTSIVRSVTFHSRDPILAIGRSDGTFNVWNISETNSSVNCVLTVEGQSGSLTSVRFHPDPDLHLLATGSCDGIFKLWSLSHDDSGKWSATCVNHYTHPNRPLIISSIKFHLELPLLAILTDSVMLWSLSHDDSGKLSTTCVATLPSDNWTYGMDFHYRLPILLTCHMIRNAKLWWISDDSGKWSATCVATLEGHGCNVRSCAFHPRAPLLATGDGEGKVIMWQVSADESSKTCVATRVATRVDTNDDLPICVSSLEFHPRESLLASVLRSDSLNFLRLLQ